MKIQINGIEWAECLNENHLPLGEGIEVIEVTQEELDALILANQPLSYFQSKAINMIKSNYQEYRSQGLSYQTYTIDNTLKTRDETAKKLLDLGANIQTCLDWTMDSPRIKITFANEQATITFLESVKCVIANNETKLRDKKTEVGNYTLEQVDAFIDNPSYPVYERVV